VVSNGSPFRLVGDLHRSELATRHRRTWGCSPGVSTWSRSVGAGSSPVVDHQKTARNDHRARFWIHFLEFEAEVIKRIC
jgi:hypothetical protein